MTDRLKKWILIFTAVFFAAPAGAALPQKGSIAVLAQNFSPQYAASAASIITRHLIAKGYRVVDPQKLAQIRKNRAAALALEGNVEAIMKLSSQYGFSTMITAHVETGEPALNEFRLYTGTASVAIMATGSNGSQLYADTVSGKQVGYTPAEAAQKSLEAAARLAVEKMTQ